MNGLLKFFVGFLITVALFACNQEIPATQIETDLELKVSASTNNIQVGNPFTYTVTVKNIGANAATEVKVIDPIPQNASYVSASSSQGSCNLKDATLTCMLGKIAVNDAANVKLVLTSNTVGKIQNTASVTSTEIDTSTTNNIASSSITLDAVPPQANLQLLGTAAPNPVQVGKNLTYTFKITNAGPDGASAIKFSDLLSQNISYVSSVTTQGTCSFAKSTLSCDLNSLALNATAEVKLIVIPNTTGTVTDTSTLRGAEVDPNTANNTTTVSATVQTPPAAPEANLGLSMTAAPNPVQTGQNLTYTLELTNAGPNDAPTPKSSIHCRKTPIMSRAAPVKALVRLPTEA